MQIRSVTAHAFGPLRGETLELAEGLTVVVGENESAKSSWHAAIYAAVCGRRRGKGRSRLDEQRFADLHRPWEGSDWLVSAVLELDDGRRVEMRHDLAGKVDCHAKDLDLGRDISSEVMHDGTPDGARWLGLDRDSFVASACVVQTQLLQVLDEADGLQEHLQRAAATAGTDATAATALDCIDEFARERIGLERANSTRPLQRAIVGRQRADEELSRCRRAHEEYLTRVETVDELHELGTAKVATVRAHEASAAAAVAEQLSTGARRATELHGMYGDMPPASVADDDALARQVAAALDGWFSRPEQTTTTQRSSSQLQEELAALPQVPDGDTEPHASVQKGVNEVTRVNTQLEQHSRSRPSAEIEVPQVAAGDDELLDLARALDVPSPDRGSVTPLQGMPGRHTARHATTRSNAVIIAAGAALAALGGALVAVTSPVVSVVVLVAGLAVVVTGVIRRRAVRGQSVARDNAVGQAHAQAAWRRDQAVARCAHLGIAADPTTLRAIPVARAHAVGLASHVAQWTQQDGELRARMVAACGELAGTLAARGYTPTGADRDALLAAADWYQQECRHRAEQASAAARRGDLEARLSVTRAAEQRAEQDEQERLRVAAAVRAAVGACSLDAATDDQAAAVLQEWVSERETQLEEVSQVEREWAELRALLAGRSLRNLQQEASSARDKASQLAAAVDQTTLASVDPSSAVDLLPVLRQEASLAETQAAAARGELKLFAGSIGSVAEAEEAVERAAAELARVRELANTLTLTRSFLSEAQTRVHRSIAPILAATVKRNLPILTGDRYTDAIVDPTTLEVQVCGSSRSWRNASRLSYGTAEQVYLLLRVALADHLTHGYDTCPLLLDDVTVHADATRTRKILDLLLEVAASRQVVLFTQEEQVATWARETLHSPRHAIRELEALPNA